MGRERKKKILGPNSSDTGPRQENFKKNSKKIQKIRKPISGNIPIQNGMRQAEKEKKKKFSSEFRLYSTRLRKFQKKQQKNIPGPNSAHAGSRQENFEKNSKKILKNFKKPLSDIIPRQNWMTQAEKGKKKNFSPEFRSQSTRAIKFRKKQQKNSKNQKTSFQH